MKSAQRWLGIIALVVAGSLLATLAVAPIFVRIAAKLVLNLCDWLLATLLRIDERLLRIGQSKLK